MSHRTIERQLRGQRPEPVGNTCTWCDADVPLPPEDLVGVCISCGMVVFRDDADRERAEWLSRARSCEGMPTPA
ncbi:MAG: hypothetical protein ACYC5A_06005 [Thermoleophilia bacterium]